MSTRTNPERAIKKLRKKLKWSVRHETSSTGDLHIASDPGRREHVIYWPGPDSRIGPPRPIEHLHELYHAWLAENVHHQFSAQRFKPGTPDEVVALMVPVCRAASDWFVDELLCSLMPQEFRAEVREHLDYILSLPRTNSAFLLFSAGLIIAQAKRYLNLEVQVAGDLPRIVETFLAVEPSPPTVGKLAELVNRLLIGYANWQVRLVHDGILEVWQVEEQS